MLKESLLQDIATNSMFSGFTDPGLWLELIKEMDGKLEEEKSIPKLRQAIPDPEILKPSVLTEAAENALSLLWEARWEVRKDLIKKMIGV